MRPTRPIIVLFYSSIVTLILILMIRLFAIDHFGGKPDLLDYGPKVSKNGKTSPTNAALEEFNFDTFAHVLQGTLATFLSYPAVSGFLSKLATRVRKYITQPKYVLDEKRILFLPPCFFTLNFIRLLQSCLTYYPCYSMVKRLRYTSFAQSSHLNNATEWTIGCILGVSLGSLASALVQRKLQLMTTSQDDRNEVIAALTVEVKVEVKVVPQVKEDEEVVMEVEAKVDEENINDNNNDNNGVEQKKETRYMFGKACEYEGVTKHPYVLTIIKILSLTNLTVFAATVFLSGLYIGLSWNYDESYSVNVGITVLYLVIFIVNFGLFFFLSLLK